MALVAQQLLSGLLQAMFLFLLAAGLSLMFGVGRVLNLAHGALYMLGAYILKTLLQGVQPVFVLAVLLSGALVGIVGAIMEVTALRQVYSGGQLYIALVTFAFTLIIEEVTRILWGSEYLSVPRPELLAGSVSWGGLEFPRYHLVILLAGVLIGAVLWWCVYRTRWGLLIRAASMDREMLEALGVNVRVLFTTVFVAGASLAGVAGALAAPTTALSPAMGSNIIMETFAVVVVGGLGNLKGNLLAAVLIAEVQAISLLFWPGIGLPAMFMLMSLILLLRPRGLLAQA